MNLVSIYEETCKLLIAQLYFFFQYNVYTSWSNDIGFYWKGFSITLMKTLQAWHSPVPRLTKVWRSSLQRTIDKI